MNMLSDPCVLIVDDSPTNLRVLADLMSSEFEVKFAKDGKSALEIIHDCPPDLVLLDIMMPEMDGYEVCKRIKNDEDTKNIPVIFITAKIELNDIVKGFEVGGVDYVTKPFNKSELMARVRTHAELKTINEQLEERVKMEIERRLDQELIFRQLFDSLNDLVAIVDSRYHYIALNKSYKKYFGIDTNEFTGKHIISTVGQDEFENIKEKIDKAFEGYITSHNSELPLPDGRVLDVEMTILPFYNSHSHIKGVIVNTKDISERNKLVKEIKDKEQMMIHQSKLADMGQMISAIAHQWRQPLNTLGLIVQEIDILNNNDELEKGVMGDLMTDSMSILNHMSNTIEDFRNYFIKDKDKKYFSILNEIKTSCSLIEAQINNHFIDLSIKENITEVNENCDVAVVYGYPGEFRQVVMNVLSNAKDAVLAWKKSNVNKAGQINITLTEEKNFFKVMIENTGFPIDEDILPNIFDPYFTTKVDEGGTGIGLYMAHRLVKNMKGQIYAENTDIGVAFYIEVPKIDWNF